jgi:hypothetical protein
MSILCIIYQITLFRQAICHRIRVNVIRLKTAIIEYMNKGNANIKQDKDEGEEQRKVKQLNQEIMFVFEKHASSFAHASAALLSVLHFISERYGKAHPENRKIVLDYFKTEFDKFLKKFAEQ